MKLRCASSEQDDKQVSLAKGSFLLHAKSWGRLEVDSFKMMPLLILHTGVKHMQPLSSILELKQDIATPSSQRL